MKFLKERHQYLIEGFRSSTVEDAKKLIKDFLSKKLGNLYPYGEEIIVKQDSKLLNGLLYLTMDEKGVRFNWEQSDKSHKIISIDLWDKLELRGDEKMFSDPSYHIDLNGNSVVTALQKIVQYFNKNVNELLDDVEGEEGKSEKSTVNSILSMDPEELKDLSIDVFESIKYNVWQVAYQMSNSLIITGQSGVGKTHDVTQALKDTPQANNYISIKGSITSAGLYETLFLNNGKLIIFDDADKVFESQESVNILKAALDTYPEREISRVQSNYFETSGMSQKDIEANFYGDVKLADKPTKVDPKNKGKFPKTFIFTGQIIFISNLKGEEIDSAVIGRSLHVDVELTKEQVLDRMRSIMQNIHPDVKMEDKEEALQVLDFLTTNFDTKFPLNVRTLIHSINIRISNDLPVEIGGKKYKLWELLLKKYLIEGKKS